MALTGFALRLSIFLGEDDMWQHKPAHREIVRRAHEAGLAGATVLHGFEGYGAASVIHTDRLLSMAEDLPIVVIIVDTADRVRAFLPQLEDVAGEGGEGGEGTVLLDEVEIHS